MASCFRSQKFGVKSVLYDVRTVSMLSMDKSVQPYVNVLMKGERKLNQSVHRNKRLIKMFSTVFQPSFVLCFLPLDSGGHSNTSGEYFVAFSMVVFLALLLRIIPSRESEKFKLGNCTKYIPEATVCS